MEERTLAGTNKQIYALLKVLKYCTGSSVRSYDCKLAVHLLLGMDGKPVPDDKFGEAIREVINFYDVRGKFDGVHKDLTNLGVTKVEVGDDGLVFLGNLSFLMLNSLYFG